MCVRQVREALHALLHHDVRGDEYELKGMLSGEIVDMNGRAPAELESHADATWGDRNVYGMLLTYGGGVVCVCVPEECGGGITPHVVVHVHQTLRLCPGRADHFLHQHVAFVEGRIMQRGESLKIRF